MRLLFDTHTFIWWDSDPNRLSEQVLSLCQNSENELLLSVVSVWEMQIKHQLNKLELRLPLAELINEQCERNGIQLLSVTLDHVLALDNLPLLHRDPFDRLLVAQANVEDILLISGDPIFCQYDVNCIW